MLYNPRLKIYIFRFCPEKEERTLIVIDDDTEVNYEELENAVQSKIKNDDLKIGCTSVLRGQRIWRHPEAPIMGKWTEPESYPGMNTIPIIKKPNKSRSFCVLLCVICR